MNKISTVFFATPDIALKSFQSLIDDENFLVKALVTQPSKPTGRGKKIVSSKIKDFAIQNNIEIIEPIKLSADDEAIKRLKELNADFFVTFAYGQILSREILEIPKFETINLHASLLPKYRGASPIAECLLNGDKSTGVTTMITVYELDAGDICIQKEIELTPETNYIELSDKISEISPEIIKKTLKGLYDGSIKPIPQDNSQATFTKKILKKDKELDFNEKSEVIHNKIRAMAYVNTTHFTFMGKVIKVLASNQTDGDNKKEAGVVLDVNKNGVIINCMEGAVLIKEVKPEGKNNMSAYSWSLGSKIKIGDKIRCIQEV